MSELTLFGHAANPTPEGVFEFDGRAIRTVTIDGDPWFAAVDVCAVLGIVNMSDALTRLNKADIGSTEVWSPSNNRRYPAKVITESGLYDLILDSRKPDARRFRRWVTAEVLPAIRRTGQYVPAPRLPQSFAEALRLAADQAQALEEAAALALEQAPKVEAHDRLMSADGLYLIGDAAKVIGVRGMGQNNLFRFLRERGVLISGGERHNVPKQHHVDAERFKVKIGSRLDSDGDAHTTRTTYLTPKGLAYVRRLLTEAGYQA